MATIDQTVRRVLACHVGQLPPTWHGRLRLAQDLHLTPLEIVLVVLDVEERLEESLHIEGIASVHTVDDLVAFVSRAVASAKRS